MSDQKQDRQQDDAVNGRQPELEEQPVKEDAPEAEDKPETGQQPATSQEQEEQWETEQPSVSDEQTRPEIQKAKMIKKTRSRKSPDRQPSLTMIKVEKRRGKSMQPSLLYYTLLFVYKSLYILGITLLRRGLRLRRRLRLGYLRSKGAFFSAVERARRFVGRVYRNLKMHIREPFTRIYDTYQQQLPAINAERARGKLPLAPALPVLELAGRLVWKILSTIFNYVSPFVAAAILIVFINNQLSQPRALRLEYEGRFLGYIQNESVFDEATQIVRERIIDQTESVAIGIPSFTIEEVQAEVYLDKDEIADMIISESGSDIITAFGLYVNNALVGAVRDKDVLLDELDAIREENSTGREGEEVEFIKSIRLSSAVYPAGSVISESELIRRIRQNETEEESYIVQTGDTPTGIADKIGVRYVELLAMNPDIEDSLYPGMELRTAVARPFLSTKNLYIETYEEEIPFERVEVQNATYARGYEDITQEGVDGLRRVVAQVTRINGVETERAVLNADDAGAIIRYPVDARVIVGTNDPVSGTPDTSGSGSGTTSTDMTPASPSGAGFMWPTTGGRATTYRNHSGNGVDIAIGPGVPIYASAAGIVSKVQSGYTGYGNHIIIDHGNGYQTLYAHNSENYVTVGQRVGQGEVIAAMGRTGNATGNHVHFEVRLNGRYMNPTDYIGYSR